MKNRDWNTILARAERKRETLAASLLARIADRYGMTPQGISTHEDLLDEGELDPSDITPAVIAQANYLAHQWNQSLAKRLAKYNRKSKEPGRECGSFAVPAPVPPKTPMDKNPPKKSRKVLGYHITKIIRWCGSEGWTEKDISRMLRKEGIEVSNVTIKVQLNLGKKGVDILELSVDQANKLYEFLE